MTRMEYKLFLKLYLGDHEHLAEDYAGMQKVITLFESFIRAEDTAVFKQLRILKKTIAQSQHVNHRAQTSVHYQLQALKSRKVKGVFKRLFSFLCASGVDQGSYYLIVQEEEQVHDFLKGQHRKLWDLLKQMYEPGVLECLSRLDRDRVESLEFFLKCTRISNRALLRNCRHMRENLKESSPYEIPSTSFQNLMRHCNNWGSKANRIPVPSKSFFARVREECQLYWQAWLFLWE